MNINKHEMSDDELDRLFSESAEKMEFDFDPDSWAKMSQKLDAVALPPSSSRGISPWLKRSLLLLAGLLAFVGGYFLLKPSANQSNETPISTNKTTENKPKEIDSKKYVETSKVDTDNLKIKERATKVVESNVPNKVNITTKESDVLSKNDENFRIKKSSETNESTEKPKVELSNKTSKKSLKSDKNKGFSEKSNEIRNNSKDDVFVKNTKKRITKPIPSKNSSETNWNNSLAETREFSIKNVLSDSENKANESQIFNNSNSNNSIKNQSNNSQTSNSVSTNVTLEENRLTLNNLGSLSPKGTFIKSSIALPVIAFEKPRTETPVVPKTLPQSFKKGLYFRFGISPDLSLVTMNDLTKSGNNLAFLVEYRFNNRLSVQGGVLRSMKYYDATQESYVWPNSWGYMPKMNDINATCKMLDIPVNVRYDISQKQLSRFFVSAGATSYIMLNEKYVYNYENPADPKIMWKNWEGKTGPYYLGVLNFSMGYEHQLFRKLSVQAEPFFKMPITNVGFGKVHLSTFGLLVSAKYPISIRK